MTSTTRPPESAVTGISDAELERGRALLDARVATAKAWNGDAAPNSRTGRAFDHAHDALDSWAGANLRAIIARLDSAERALKPFAEVADWYGADESDDFEVWQDYPHGLIDRRIARLANFRAAAAHFKAIP